MRNVSLSNEDLKKFKAWAVEEGWLIEPAQGDYEIFRLVQGAKSPLVFYRRKNGKITARSEAGDLLMRWLVGRR